MIVNFNNLTNILYNTTAINKIMFNNVEVWSKETRPYPDWVYELGTPIYALKREDDALGAAYINTGLSFNTLTQGYETTLYTTDDILTTALWGARDVTGVSTPEANNIFRNIGASSRLRADCIGNTANILDIYSNKEYKVRCDSAGFWVDDVRRAQRVAGGLTEQPFYIGAVNAGGEVTIKGTNQLIFPWRFYDLATGEDFATLIPFKANDGALGLLNLISRELLTNDGSGEFEEVSLESTAAQLINLGVTPSSSVEENIVMLNNMGVSV